MKIINKKTLIILLILVILIVIFDFYLINTKKKPIDDTKDDNNKIIKIRDENDILKELAYNNYLLTYILKGDVQVSDGGIEIDGIEYVMVNDDTIKNIKATSDIVSLINSVIDSDAPENYIDYLKDYNYNNYVSNSEHLYVKKGISICHNLAPYNENNVVIEDDGEGKIITVGNVKFNVVKVDDNWYTTALEYPCLD